MTKIGGSGSESISQRYRSADTDPDPHQNVMDLQHCLPVNSTAGIDAYLAMRRPVLPGSPENTPTQRRRPRLYQYL
jgi:hypothetical protein